MRIKKVSGKKGSGIKKLFGSRSRKKGKASEALFNNFCIAQGAFAVRIHDAVKGPNFAGPSQIADFLVFKDGKVCIADVKSEQRVCFSRLSQLNEWEKIVKKTGFSNLSFVFVWPNGLHYLSLWRIISFKENKKPGMTLRDSVRKLDSINRLLY